LTFLKKYIKIFLKKIEEKFLIKLKTTKNKKEVGVCQ